MSDLVIRLAKEVALKIRKLGFDEPNLRVINDLLEIAYLGTLRSEEGRFVKGSLTFANPNQPDVHPPLLRRADYPMFTKFGSPENLNVQALVKLARAIDRWSGSIAVYTSHGSGLVAWGVLDQLVQQNVRWHRESIQGFTNPGLLTVTMDGVGDISAYHGEIFLGGLKAQSLVIRESDALETKSVSEYGSNALAPYAKAIHRVRDGEESEAQILEDLVGMWAKSIARLCIGLRQRETGGAFLLTPKPQKGKLQIKHSFEYPRLRDASVLSVLDDNYSFSVGLAQSKFTENPDTDAVPVRLVLEDSLAQADAKDREDELTGAVKLVASLAAVDGLVLMSPALSVLGFGVKIGSAPSVATVYDGADFALRGTRARKIDQSQYGTRHGSMFRYCAQDRSALGIVVSQDGYVRLIMTVRNSLVFWENLKLLNHQDFSRQAVQSEKKRRERSRTSEPVSLGYTDMPKTIDLLMKAASQRPQKSSRKNAQR